MSFDPPASGSFPQAPPAPSLVGEVIGGRYRIFKKLGEGGMGEVYAAEHVHIDKKFALKVLKAEIVSNAEAVKRFQQEARSSSSIKHRNIIAVEDFDRLPDGRIYMCMELLGGAPLNEMIQQPMAADRLLNILIQSGHGLAAAHAKGIVHRDMKPENIYVTQDASGDVPKLLDFGIAKVSGNDGQNNLTRTGTIFGTPFYMAPEQALGNPVDARTDIYAMGVIMYECFAGSLPFQGESFMGILTQHITTEPEPVAQRAGRAGRGLPHGIAEIITRCMQKDPKQRFQTMDELVNALIQVYRTIAGAGMSTYMEAFPVGSTGHMAQPTPGPMTGMQNVSGAQAPTMAAGGAGYRHPTPGQSQPMMTPQQFGGSGPGAALSPSQSGLYDPSASQVAVGKKSKTGLIVAVAVLVAVGGGITAIVLLGKNKNKDPGGGSGSGTGVASGDNPGSDKPGGDNPSGKGPTQMTLPDNAAHAFAGLTIEAPGGTTMEAAENGTEGAVVAVRTSAGTFTFSLNHATAIADGKRHAASDPLLKFVKYHEDTATTLLWQGESKQTPGEMEHQFVATVQVGDGRVFECDNRIGTDIDLAKAQQLLAICKSLKSSGSGSQTQANGGSGSGSPTNDNGSGNQSGDGSATLPPKPDGLEVAIFTEPFVNDFEIWEDGKKVQNGDEDLIVSKGAPRKIVIKAKGFKDSKPIVVDGKKKRVRVKLEAKGGTKPPVDNTKPPGIDCSVTIKDPKNKKCIAQFCATHGDDMRCDAE